MQCQEFEHRLNAVLDERRDPISDQRLASHARHCEHCRDLLDAQQALFTGLRNLSTPPLASDFAQRIVSKTAASMWSTCSASGQFPALPHPEGSQANGQPAKLHSPRLARLVAGALLASAAIAVFAVSLAWHANNSEPALNSRRTGTITGPSVPKGGRMRRHGLAIVRPGQHMKRDVAADNPAFTGKAWLVEAPRLPEHVLEYRGALASLAGALPETEQRLDQMEQLAPGLRPIRRSLAVLWETLWRALPASGSSDEPRAENGYPKV